MLDLLRAELERHKGKMAIGYSLMNGGGTEGTLLSVDEFGVVIRNEEGVCLYPWTAIKRIRMVE